MDRSVVVVSRKVGQRVMIGEGAGQVVVEVVKPNGRGARLRIEAPPAVSVRREELPARSSDAVA